MNKIKAFTLIEVLVVIAIVSLLAAMIISVVPHKKESLNQSISAEVIPPAAPSVVISDTEIPYLSFTHIRTIQHDGHWFILYTCGEHGSMLHSPDCPKCKSARD